MGWRREIEVGAGLQRTPAQWVGRSSSVFGKTPSTHTRARSHSFSSRLRIHSAVHSSLCVTRAPWLRNTPRSYLPKFVCDRSKFVSPLAPHATSCNPPTTHTCECLCTRVCVHLVYGRARGGFLPPDCSHRGTLPLNSAAPNPNDDSLTPLAVVGAPPAPIAPRIHPEHPCHPVLVRRPPALPRGAARPGPKAAPAVPHLPGRHVHPAGGREGALPGAVRADGGGAAQGGAVGSGGRGGGGWPTPRGGVEPGVGAPPGVHRDAATQAGRAGGRGGEGGTVRLVGGRVGG